MRMKMMFDELRLRDMTSRELGLTDFVPEQDIELETGRADPAGAAELRAGRALGDRSCASG